MGPAFFYALLARFPVRSPLDPRLPWVRPALLVFAGVIWVPLATEDLASVLADVNRSFSESTARNHFATFFIGRYEDDTRQLCYANCGHLPPMIARADGTLERLGVTASAIGLLDEWTGAVGQVVLNRGDVLAIFSDGVTEAITATGARSAKRGWPTCSYPPAAIRPARSRTA